MNTIIEEIKSIVANVDKVPACIVYVTEVKTAAKFKDVVKIVKETIADVVIYGKVEGDVYQSLVRERGAGENAPTFEVSQTSYFDHSDPECYSIVTHKKTGKPYLYAIFEKVNSSEYFIDGNPATKDDVVEYLTPSEAKKLMEPKSTVVNVSQNVEHDVIVRTIACENVRLIEAR